MTAVIIDYGSGNLRSAEKALARAAAESDYAGRVTVSADPETVLSADHVVLPGVGAFRDCRRGLDAVPGMVAALGEVVRGRGRPFLGVCVGMQLLADTGLEHGETAGLGWIGGVVDRIAPDDPALRVPHMGWNRIAPTAAGAGHPLLRNLPDEPYGYFVHAYGFRDFSAPTVLAGATYGGPLVAAVGVDNVFGVQFHPEKSQRTGLAILRAFLAWRP